MVNFFTRLVRTDGIWLVSITGLSGNWFLPTLEWSRIEMDWHQRSDDECPPTPPHTMGLWSKRLWSPDSKFPYQSFGETTDISLARTELIFQLQLEREFICSFSSELFPFRRRLFSFSSIAFIWGCFENLAFIASSVSRMENNAIIDLCRYISNISSAVLHRLPSA